MSSYPADVYDKDNTNCTIATYVEAYKDYLKNNLKAPIKEARLLKYSEAIVLGCGNGARSCKNSPANAPSWVYGTSFWLGSANGTRDLWYVNSNGYFYYGDCSYGGSFGVRPVIVI